MEISDVDQEDTALSILEDVEQDIDLWVELRRRTVAELREIADYIETVTKDCGIAKATFKGSSILGGVLTVVGGGLTIASAGGAAPVLLTGLGLGLASGFGGGGATITRKIIKSRQMKAAKQAVLKDSLATAQLEAKVEQVGKNKRIERKIAGDLILTGKCVASNVKKIAKLIARGSAETTDALIPSGVVNATTTIFGETATVSRAVSKAAVVTSGRIFSGAFTIVVGGATVVYDIYCLHKEIEGLSKLELEGQRHANHVRLVAQELEESLETLLATLDAD